MLNIDGTFADFSFTDDQQSKLKDIKTLMQDHPQIRFQTDNIFLSKYLECVDWDVNLALERIIKVYKFKADNPDWCFIDGPLGYQDLFDMHFRYPLKKKDINGRLVVIYKPGNVGPNVTMHQLAQFDDMCFECLIMEQSAQRNGLTFIIDCKDYPMRMFKWLTPKTSRISGAKSDLIPLRNFDFHIVNTSPVVDVAIAAANAIIMPFLSGPIKERLHFHKKNWAALHEYTGKDCLPEEYGGCANDAGLDFGEFNKILADRHEYVKQIIDYGYVK